MKKHFLLMLTALCILLASCTDTSDNLGEKNTTTEKITTESNVLPNQNLQIAVKEVVSGLRYDYIGNFIEGLAVIRVGEIGINDKWGFIDTTGNLVIPTIYNHVSSFSKDGLAFVMQDGKQSLIAKDGSTVIELGEYDYGGFSEGLITVSKNGKMGVIDKTGNLIVPCIYGGVGKFQDGLAVVWNRTRTNGNYDYQVGYIDKSGNEVIPLEYDWISGLEERDTNFPEGLQAVQKDGKCGYIDKTGAVILPFIYDNATNFNEGFAAVYINGEWNFIDKTGEVIFPSPNGYKFSSSGFSEGLTLVWNENEEMGYVDINGDLVIPCEYDYADKFDEGIALMGKDGKIGWIDKTGEVVIPFKYDYALAFSEGLTAARIGDWENGKWGYIDRTGRVVVPFEFNEGANFMNDFNEGVAAVQKDDGTFSILQIVYEAVDTNEDLNGITDIADWEKLGLSKDDIRYMCLKAFIEGDTATLAEINDKSLPIEAYDIYKTIEIGEYTVTYQENPNDSSGDVMFHVNIISSGVSYYPAGEHLFIAYNGIDGNYIKNPQITQRIEHNTEAQETLFIWLAMSGTYELYDYSSLQGEFQETYSYWITDYLQYTFRDDNVMWTIDEMQKYTEKYFGIVDFMPPEKALNDKGIYDTSGHGLNSWYYKYIDEYADDSLVTLTVQFYADAPMIIQSHIIEYKLQKIERGYKFLGSEIIYKSPYERKRQIKAYL